jgi:hypothetical protein
MIIDDFRLRVKSTRDGWAYGVDARPSHKTDLCVIIFSDKEVIPLYIPKWIIVDYPCALSILIFQITILEGAMIEYLTVDPVVISGQIQIDTSGSVVGRRFFKQLVCERGVE